MKDQTDGVHNLLVYKTNAQQRRDTGCPLACYYADDKGQQVGARAAFYVKAMGDARRIARRHGLGVWNA